MNEAPPVPVSDSFNVTQWNATDTGKSATQSWVSRNFLSRVIADTASQIISFTLGIKANILQTITAGGTASVYLNASTVDICTNGLTRIGNGASTVQLGSSTNTAVNIYKPKSLTTIASPEDNTTNIPSTSWVQNWWTYIKSIENEFLLTQTFQSILCDRINVKAFNGTAYLYDSAGVINFATNTGCELNMNPNGVTYFGNGNSDITIGSVLSANTKLYFPVLETALLTSEYSKKIPSTEWVKDWWSTILATALNWASAQTFSNGILLNQLDVGGTGFYTKIDLFPTAIVPLNILNGNYSIPERPTLNIACGTNTVGNNAVNILTNGKGVLNLGNAVARIVLGCPIEPNYTFTSDGTGFNKIGEIISGNYSGGTGAFASGAGTEKTYSSITLTGVGVYTVFFQAGVTANGNITRLRLRVESNTVNAPYGTKYGEINTYIGSMSGALLTNSIHSTIYNAGTRIYTAKVYLEFVGVQPEAIGTDFLFLITRIA